MTLSCTIADECEQTTNSTDSTTAPQPPYAKSTSKSSTSGFDLRDCVTPVKQVDCLTPLLDEVDVSHSSTESPPNPDTQ